jgi:hypothetical protein
VLICYRVQLFLQPVAFPIKIVNEGEVKCDIPD